ncbi:hypothetical protein J4Q44_G00334780 [Coregonus suidteri]|uniref:Uncharacterized protein n=1 Tax=Coregonus suidteri TaxID=861788 RepID=A0AAN8L1G6_9TELE
MKVNNNLSEELAPAAERDLADADGEHDARPPEGQTAFSMYEPGAAPLSPTPTPRAWIPDGPPAASAPQCEEGGSWRSDTPMEDRTSLAPWRWGRYMGPKGEKCTAVVQIVTMTTLRRMSCH